jgi:hypothetical protein
VFKKAAHEARVAQGRQTEMSTTNKHHSDSQKQSQFMPTTSKSVDEVFAASSSHMQLATKELLSLREHIDKQSVQLALCAFEPELWYRLFPSDIYETLRQNFHNVYRSGRSLSMGTAALSTVIRAMISKEEDVSQHLSLVQYMANHLFLISMKSTLALSSAHDALKR